MEANINKSQDNLIKQETLTEMQSPPSSSIPALNMNQENIKAITNDEALQKRLKKMHLFEAGDGLKTEQKEGKVQCERCEQWLKQEQMASHTTQHSSQILDFLYLGSVQNSSNFKWVIIQDKYYDYFCLICDQELTGKIQISYILNAATELNNVFPKFFVYKKLDLEDVLDQKITPFFQECIKFIERARKEEKNILVHCIQGVSRSVTIVLAYLMFKGMTLKASFDLVRQKRPVSRPNVQFVKELLAYELSLYNQNSCTGCYINPLY